MMEQFKKTTKRIINGLFRLMGSRVLAAVLMCAVTLSMVMGVSSHSLVYTVREGDSSRVVVTLSDSAPYLSLDGKDTIWVDTTVDEEVEKAEAMAVEVRADGLATLLHLTDADTTVSDAIEQAGVTVGKLDRVSVDPKKPVSDGMLVQVDRIAYEEYTVTKTVYYETKYQYSCVLKPGVTRVQTAGRNGEVVTTYRKSYVNGVVVADEKVSEETTQSVVNQVVLKGASYGKILSKPPTSIDIPLDEKNQPLEYSRKIYGSCTAYHGGTGTATGRKPAVGIVAVDPREIPYGSVLWITSADGSFVYGYAIAGDTGGFIYNSSTVADLYMPTNAEVYAFGRRNLNVYVIKEGNGK